MDIGASKTEIAIVGKEGIVTGCSVDIGGDKLTKAIADYMIEISVGLQKIHTALGDYCRRVVDDFDFHFHKLRNIIVKSLPII